MVLEKADRRGRPPREWPVDRRLQQIPRQAPLLPPRCRKCGEPATSYCETWLCLACYEKTHVRDRDGILHHLTRGERPPAVLRSLERRRRLWE